MSPRAFDSDEVRRAEAPLLTFDEIVTCPECGLEFEGEFADESGAMDVEDLTDPPVGHHQCPGCGYHWVSEATGWSFFSEAG